MGGFGYGSMEEAMFLCSETLLRSGGSLEYLRRIKNHK